MEHLFYNGWEGLARTFLVGTLAYACLIATLRLSGKRTLSKMNAFDLIVTISLGSTLASALLNKDVAVAEAAIAFLTLVGLQFVITWTSVHAPWFRRVITGEPLLLLENGTLIPAALHHARLTEGEVHAAIRSVGVSHIGEVAAVILETNGTFSVIRGQEGSGASTLKGVRRIGEK